METQENRTWALLGHLAWIAGFVIPFAGVVAPLILWMTKGKESKFVADHSLEAINFQIGVMIISLGAVIPMFFMVFLPVVGIIFILLLLGIGLTVLTFQVVCTIQAAIKAKSGEAYRYPLSIRLVKPRKVALPAQA